MIGFLNSKFGLVLVGFVLTTLAGGFISMLLKKALWQRQTRIDLYRKRYEEGTRFLDSLSQSIGTRFFALQRFLWAIGEVDDEKLKEIEASYFLTVRRWNSTYWTNRNKIRLLVGDQFAADFLDYRDDYRLEAPESLHYHFVKAHRYVMGVRKEKHTAQEAQKVVDTLNWVCSTILERLTTEFSRKAISLELLKLPEQSESSLFDAAKERGKTVKPPRTWETPKRV